MTASNCNTDLPGFIQDIISQGTQGHPGGGASASISVTYGDGSKVTTYADPGAFDALFKEANDILDEAGALPEQNDALFEQVDALFEQVNAILDEANALPEQLNE